MSEFSISTGNTENAAENFLSIERKIDSISNDIDDCRSNLSSMKGLTAEIIKRKLRSLQREVIESASHMSTISDALRKVNEIYIKHENNVLTSEFSNSKTSGKDKRGWFRKFVDMLFDRKVNEEYTATTQEQEQAADREMMNRISRLADKDRYSQETWEKATLEQKKEILQDYCDEVERILGLNIKKEIKFFDKPRNDKGMYTHGQYVSSKNRIEINVNELSYYEFTTVVHELRHAYQYEAIKHPDKYRVSQETIDSWKYNYKHYIDGNVDYPGYRAQPIEADARRFSGDV